MYPTREVYITVPYGQKGDLWAAGYHTGTDFRASVGTPVYASRGGTVVHVGWGGYGSAYGYHVILACRTRFGTSRRVLYAHMSSAAVKYGSRVAVGDYLGHSGATGHVYGAHLHYEERTSPYGYWNHQAPVFLKYSPIVQMKRRISLSKVKPGQTNRHIKRVQKRLNQRLPGQNLPTTGFYGSMTKAKYKEWQKHLGFTGEDADGVAGRKSLQALGFNVVP
jgi:murein DD-endopeptidase MepM/ murein hydrolase activator NlpD